MTPADLDPEYAPCSLLRAMETLTVREASEFTGLSTYTLRSMEDHRARQAAG